MWRELNRYGVINNNGTTVYVHGFAAADAATPIATTSAHWLKDTTVTTRRALAAKSACRRPVATTARCRMHGSLRQLKSRARLYTQ